ncbi:hypothetical protein [Streptomyces alboflavus]|uniref:hypothetical protein n=1 Tax=Streptomyces alboflavus TaxID=67267 RepID=UPI0036C5B542
MARQVRAMRRGRADPVRAGVEAIARELGRAMDTAGLRRDPYAVAQVAPKLLDVLDRLAPKEGEEAGALAALVSEMQAPD